jgi:addiction module HigA family antidote
MAMKAPSHVGGFIRRQIVEPLKLTVTDAALALGVTRQALNNLLNGKAALTAEMALRIEKAFGPKADHLMRMQLAYDMAEARRLEATLNVRRVAARLSPATGREQVREQALLDLAAAREQRRLGGRVIAMVAAGEMTAAKAAQLLQVDAAAISRLVDRAKASAAAPPPRPRPPPPTR